MSFYESLIEFNGLPVRSYQSGQPAPDDPGAYAWKISIDYEEWEEWDADGFDGRDWFIVKLRELAAQPWASEASSIVLGANAYEGTETDTQAIAAALAKLPVTALFYGDITQEENEVSWIELGELKPLCEAIPGIEVLTIRSGGTNTTMESVSLPRLRKFVYQSGGLPESVLTGIVDSDLPALTDLELWLGIEEYGGMSDVSPLEPLLAGEHFPMLARLGLCNSEIQDAVAVAVADSSLVCRVSELALSYGALTDEGADALATTRLAHLTSLDIHHHYVSDEAVARLRAALSGTTIDASDRQRPKVYGGEIWYPTFVSE